MALPLFPNVKSLFFAAIFLPLAGPSFAQNQPNIIWLMAEDISTDLACYGMQAVQTPNLDAMAARGVRFDNCFVTNPICSPSRSAMMVGSHQIKTNTHHHRSNREIPLDGSFKPFTYWLRNEGYTTILGHHGVRGKGRKTDVNFKHTKIGPWDGKTQFGLFDKLDTFTVKDQPFFAQIQLNVTHRGGWWDDVRAQSKHPVDPAKVVLPDYMADHPAIRLDWAKYLDQMEYADDEVGMIFAELEAKGMAEHTIVIFIGDNGRCNIRGKGYLHDAGLHIPLIVYSPYGNLGAKIRKDVVSATDITATILDLAGIKVPKYMTGAPIFDASFDRKYTYAGRDLWDEVEEQSRALTSGKWKYIRNDKPDVPFDAEQAYLEFYRPAVHVMRTLREEGKLNEHQLPFFLPQKPAEELYDLEKDPQELVNLINDEAYARTLKKLRKKTRKYDRKMKPVSDVYKPTHAISVDVLEWVKREKPEVYQKMQEGVEVGFHLMVEAYKKSLAE
ncbi:MAG: sulfatase [Lewinella sp.]